MTNKNLDIELHLFTNSTINAPSTYHIETTYKTFKLIFNLDLKPIIWCDVNPYVDRSNKYIENLKKIYGDINITDSLASGYTKAIENSKSKFLFMVEHDWNFNYNIKHSLELILDEMEHSDITHLRFNQFINGRYFRDKQFKQIKGKNFDLCQTKWISNNPHIINREKYLNSIFKNIVMQKGSFGIEQAVSYKNYFGHIYGPTGYPPTLYHLNGRGYKKL